MAVKLPKFLDMLKNMPPPQYDNDDEEYQEEDVWDMMRSPPPRERVVEVVAPPPRLLLQSTFPLHSPSPRQGSPPMDIQDLSKSTWIHRKKVQLRLMGINYHCRPDFLRLFDKEGNDSDDDEEFTPSHVIVARSNTVSRKWVAAYGLSIKGKDLFRLREAVLQATVFRNFFPLQSASFPAAI